jgi:hypothetical protein
VVDELDDDVGARQGLVTTIASVIVGDDRDAARRARRRVARDPRLADVVERVRHLAA